MPGVAFVIFVNFVVFVSPSAGAHGTSSQAVRLGGHDGSCVAVWFGEREMLKWALIFAVIALIAGALGFGGIAGAAAGIAKILFFLFVIGFVIFLALGIFAGKKIAGD